MPNFMVRPNPGNVGFFHHVPQIGKRFFYHLDAQGYPVNDNTVVTYEASLEISQGEFEALIDCMTGQKKPTIQENGYGYHLEKSRELVDVNFLTNRLGLPPNIGSYLLKAVAVAANYTKKNADGNILIVFEDTTSAPPLRNEACISLHIKHSAFPNTEYFPKLTKTLLPAAVQQLQPETPVHQLQPWEIFPPHYVVTGGQQEEIDYKNAYDAQQAANAPQAA